jgi:hypothetical protein
MSRVVWRALPLIALLLVPAPAPAAARFGEMGGHLSIGYVKLFTAHAPGGSMSMGAGLDYPLKPTLRFGLDVGYDLLGSRSVQRGSLFGSVDLSAFEATAFLHWLPQRGPVRRVSVGPGLLNAHGDLSVTGGGASFSDLAVHETAGAAVAQVTLMPAKPGPVKLGLELGGRVAFLAGEDWTLLHARVTVHF